MINLFCFPYAGGSAYAYSSWKKGLTENVNLKLIELTGRGVRIGESLYPTMEAVINDLYDKIKNDLGEHFAFFGHSMGAIIAYELALKVSKEEGRIANHLFLSGRGFPKIKENDFKHELPEDEFKEVLMNLEGTPKEVFQNPTLSKLFLPIIRSDYRLVERYIPRKNMLQSINTEVSVLSGINDIFSNEELEKWAIITNKKCTIKYFNGGHFFINEKKEELINYINEVLEVHTI
ncbi:thioesterase domain-containing protein [uncultured Kordia sp.]|uniref:thioesterase II family protein n=1 Tax=uncultured Kordia sp. TaxID=507699 RepID=UPI00261B3233|nr:thioesterase domain-containing protein [uncultured Kordia sp.]